MTPHQIKQRHKKRRRILLGQSTGTVRYISGHIIYRATATRWCIDRGKKQKLTTILKELDR